MFISETGGCGINYVAIGDGPFCICTGLCIVHSCGIHINDRWNLHANTSKTQLVTTEMVFHGISRYFHNLCPS